MSKWYARFPLTPEPEPKILTEEVRRKARIGRTHWEARIQQVPDRLPYKAAIKRYIRHMHDWYEPAGCGLVLYGKVGHGKTALGSIVLRNALARGGYALSIRATEMVDHLYTNPNFRFDPGWPPLIEMLHGVTFLLLDDLVEEDKDWRLRYVENVLRARYDERLPTIITTNVDKDSMFAINWLKSLFFERYHGIEVSGINWRLDPP